ncbi:hypothetical protein J6590_064161 [Homalodisca vitripennis]|nr:hypothetical protein J6590_064161 [Homalodisca vitripennis]
MFLRYLGVRTGFLYREVPVDRLAEALCLPPLAARRKVQDLMFLYKIINGLTDFPELLELPVLRMVVHSGDHLWYFGVAVVVAELLWLSSVMQKLNLKKCMSKWSFAVFKNFLPNNELTMQRRNAIHGHLLLAPECPAQDEPWIQFSTMVH